MTHRKEPISIITLKIFAEKWLLLFIDILIVVKNDLLKIAKI